MAFSRLPAAGDPGFQPVALVDELGDRVLVDHVARRRQDGGQRLTEGAFRLGSGTGEHAAPRFRRQRCDLALLDHLEMAGDIGLEGELVQQALAEGVDGLDLEAARRLQRTGEEAAGGGKQPAIGRTALQRRQLFGELVVGEPGPFGQRLEDAAGHFRGRRLGEGQAQDAPGIGAGEQQADHPAGEHEGLARAGIGRHPGRGGRIRGVGLRLQRHAVDVGGGAHSSSPLPSTSAHSRTRARWS